jgi:hypothetical protein
MVRSRSRLERSQNAMKTISILTVGGIVMLVILRLNGVSTEIPELDVMVGLFMQSIHLA